MTTHKHLIDMERDLGITLIGTETEKEDFEETPYMHGDDVHYVERWFTRFSFLATGFKLIRDGVTISGNFAQPIEAVAVETDNGGEPTNTDYNDGAVARAVLAKLGGIPDVEGGLLAAAGV